MKTRYLFLIVALSSCAYAQSINVAVNDFKPQGLEASASAIISDRLRNELVNTNVFTVVERGQMEEILKEQGFQQSGCTSDACVVEVGQILGVQYMIAGSIGKLGNVYTISARLIDVGTGKIARASNVDCPCEIGQVLSKSTAEIARKLAAATGKKEVTPKEPEIRKPEAPLYGKIEIKSKPSGADVLIEGKNRGKTPLALDKQKPGTYALRIALETYSQVSDSIMVVANRVASKAYKLARTKEYLDSVSAAEFAKSHGGIEISSAPQGAKILLNNTFMGITPFKSDSVRAGRYRLKLLMPTYAEVKEKLTVKAGKRLQRKYELQHSRAYSDSIVAIEEAKRRELASREEPMRAREPRRVKFVFGTSYDMQLGGTREGAGTLRLTMEEYDNDILVATKSVDNTVEYRLDALQYIGGKIGLEIDRHYLGLSGLLGFAGADYSISEDTSFTPEADNTHESYGLFLSYAYSLVQTKLIAIQAGFNAGILDDGFSVELRPTDGRRMYPTALGPIDDASMNGYKFKTQTIHFGGPMVNVCIGRKRISSVIGYRMGMGEQTYFYELLEVHPDMATNALEKARKEGTYGLFHLFHSLHAAFIVRI